MSNPSVFCPGCGAADTSIADPQGVRVCVHCHARYQLSSPVGHGVSGGSVPRGNTSNIALMIGISVVGVLGLGVGLGAFLLSPVAQDPEEPVVVTEVVKVVEVEKVVTVKEEVTPEPPEVKPDVKTVEPVAVVASPRPSVRPGTPDPALRYRVGFEGANLRGAADAPITIVIFYDFECPFCKRLKKSLAEVELHYKGDVRFAYMHQPLSWHKGAMPAAKAAEAAADQGKFWEMYLLMSENPKELTSSNFERWARELGLKKKRFDKVFNDPATEQLIKSEQAEAIRLGARGVPAVFVNGRFLPGTQPFSGFQTLIDEELIIANKRIADGTKRGDVYESLMKEALPGV